MKRRHLGSLPLAVAALALALPLLKAEPVTFYLGTLTRDHPGKGIYRGSIDTDTGKLGPIQLIGPANEVHTIAISSDRAWLYATQADTFAVYRLSNVDDLKLIDSRRLADSDLGSVCVDQDIRHIVVSNRKAATLSCYELGKDGKIGQRTALQALVGSGADPDRQSKSHPVDLAFGPDDKILYCSDLGADALWTLRFYYLYGSIVSDTPALEKAPAGSGPGPFVLLPNNRFLFAVNQLQSGISTYFREPDHGRLKLLETHTLGTKGAENVFPSAIVCDPSSQWVYVALQGSNQLVAFYVTAEGKLKLLGGVPSGVRNIRALAVDPTSHWLLVCGQDDGQIAVFQIDQLDGKITPTSESASVPGVSCLVFPPKLKPKEPEAPGLLPPTPTLLPGAPRI